MRVVLGGLALLIVAGMAEPAAAQDYPWCAHYSRSGTKNCGFVSFEQCRATVSGIGGFCAINPFYAAAYSDAPRVRKYKRRHYY